MALRACMVATVMAATSMGTQVLAAYQSVNSCWNFVINILDAIGIAGRRWWPPNWVPGTVTVRV